MDVMGLTNERVLEQLARIVSSEDFQASERLKDFLTFVVEETLAGRGESIKAYTIALAVFGRGVDFDPMLDPIVRVEAGRLRKLLERYYFLHPSDPVLIKIPRGNYIPLFNLRAGDEQAATDSAQEEPGVKNELEVILGKQLRIDDTELRQEKRPVLLFIPFSNLTGDPALSPLILGLAEDLLLRLNPNKLVDLRVASAGRGVDGEYINSFDAAFPVARSEARFILHGHVQAGDGLLRLYVSLTDARDNRRIWTEKFDIPYPARNFLETQEAVSAKIVGALVDSFGIIARLLMQEVSYLDLNKANSYETSLLYYIWESTQDKGNYIRAIQGIERSLATDPYNQSLLAGLSRLYSADHHYAFNRIPENLNKSMDLAKMATGIDDGAPLGRLAMAHSLFVQGRKQALDETLKILLSMDLTPYALSVVGFFTGLAFDLEEGMALQGKAAGLNPRQPGYHQIVPFLHHYSRGDFESAMKHTLLLNMPTNVWDPILRSITYHKLNQPYAVQNAVEHIFVLEPDFKNKREQLLRAMLFDGRWMSLVSEGLWEVGL